MVWRQSLNERFVKLLPPPALPFLAFPFYAHPHQNSSLSVCWFTNTVLKNFASKFIHQGDWTIILSLSLLHLVVASGQYLFYKEFASISSFPILCRHLRKIAINSSLKLLQNCAVNPFGPGPCLVGKFVCMYTWVCRCMCVEAGEQPGVSVFRHSPCFLRQHLPLAWS